MSVSPEHYASFLERMGHTVRKVDGMWWFNTNRGVYTGFPFDQNVDATTISLSEILGHDGLLVRFGCPVEQGVTSHRILCSDKAYDFPSLRSRTRTQVRRGLEDCKIERIEFAELSKHAIQLNIDTLIRQERKVPANIETYWKKYYEAASVTEGAEAWAAWCEGRLAAYVIAFTIGTTANMLIVRSALDLLPKFPNNALLFQYLYNKIREPQIEQVVYGYESIQAGLGSLDQFKTGMGFQLDPVGQRIELARWVRPFVNRYTTAMASRFLQRLGKGETPAKLQGILNWYRDQPTLSQPDSAAA
ncbi:MAG: hypothetical protein JNL58_25755 [Planctomyces sp.]|nr:hypothetical protein [Planctomyces sp.]